MKQPASFAQPAESLAPRPGGAGRRARPPLRARHDAGASGSADPSAGGSQRTKSGHGGPLHPSVAGGSESVVSRRRRFASLGRLLPAILAALVASEPAAANPFAYVLNNGSDDVSVIDAAVNTVGPIVPVGRAPFAIAISPIGRFAYVVNAGDPADRTPDVLTVIDTTRTEVVREVAVGDFPQGVAATPDGRYVYVSSSGSTSVSDGTVIVVDTAAALRNPDESPVVAVVPVGGNPAGAAITPDGRFAYVTNFSFGVQGVVFVIETAAALDDPNGAVVDTIAVGNNPLAIAITPDGRFAYVTNFAFGSNTVSVLDLRTNRVATTVVVGSRPAGVAVSPDGRFAYVTNLISETVSIIRVSDHRVVATVGVGRAPHGVAFTRDGAVAYVANRQSLGVSLPGAVSVIDATRAATSPGSAVVGTLAVGNNPVAVATGPVVLQALIGAIFASIQPTDADINADDRVGGADITGLFVAPQLIDLAPVTGVGSRPS